MLGPGIDDSQGTVLSVSEQTGMVTIQLDPEGGEDRHPRYSDTIQVPITRVMPVRNEVKWCFHFCFLPWKYKLNIYFIGIRNFLTSI